MSKYPTQPSDLKAVDVVKKSKLCKEELREKFPELDFRKSSKRYAGGSSFRIYVEQGEDVSEAKRKKIKKIVRKYQYYYHNQPQFDLVSVDNYAFAVFAPKGGLR